MKTINIIPMTIYRHGRWARERLNMINPNGIMPGDWTFHDGICDGTCENKVWWT